MWGGDHTGPALKKVLITHLESQGVEVINRGTDSQESVDYPDHAHAVSEDVANASADFGILICGSANGVAMTANKHQSVRAGLAWNSEVAKLVKQHNNANVLCIPARFVTESEGLDILKAYMEEEFEGGRHERRVNKIACAVILCLLSLVPSLQALAQLGDPQPYAATIMADDFENHLMVLASDAFEGRETGERGAEKAAAYIASHFNSLGIEPYDGSTYYQPVKLIRSQIAGGQASVNGNSLVFLEDFLFYPGLKVSVLEDVSMVAVSSASAIASADVAGKAVVMAGTDGLSEVREMSNAGGAVAVVVVSEDISTLRSRMKPWLMRKSLRLDREEPKEREGTRIPTFMVDAAGAWTKRMDVRNVHTQGSGGPDGRGGVRRNDWLTVSGNKIGIETGIGHQLGNALDAPVLILKSSIGNRSLGWDLLPPGSPRHEVETVDKKTGKKETGGPRACL